MTLKRSLCIDTVPSYAKPTVQETIISYVNKTEVLDLEYRKDWRVAIGVFTIFFIAVIIGIVYILC